MDLAGVAAADGGRNVITTAGTSSFSGGGDPGARAAVPRPLPLLFRIAPGLKAARGYRFSEDFRHDAVAGLCVASVAVPVAIAYAQLAGFRPEVGLYSSILPLLAYAIFGTSRRLIINPDAAVCAMVAASVAPLAAGDPKLYASLSVMLAFFAGIFCILASIFRLGAVADFLSKPILVGFMNGVALSILQGQVGKICGITIKADGMLRWFTEVASKLPQTHLPTLAIGLGSLGVLLLLRRLVPQAPSALIVLIVAGALIAALKLDGRGVAVLGVISGGLPTPRFPEVPTAALPALTAKAAGLALVIFSGGVVTARSFANKDRCTVDMDAELAALGAANIASALGQGFAVTDADSRTAVAYTSGGRTQMTGLVAAACMILVLLFLAKPLRYVPIPALGAILIVAAISLFDLASLRHIWRVDKGEAALSLITTLGAVLVGPINGILVAVTLALARFIRRTARPADEILGKVEGMPGFHSIERHPGAQTIAGLQIYRFGGPITFFNAAYFKERALAAADAAGPALRWFVVDAVPITSIDVTGVDALDELRRDLAERGTDLVVAGRRTEFLTWLKQIGLDRAEDHQFVFPTLHQAVRAFRETEKQRAAQSQPRSLESSS
jgi:high affinity sulfate transporter 1